MSLDQHFILLLAMLQTGIFGLGGQKSSKSQSASSTLNENTKNKKAEEEAQKQASQKSESIETTVEALGGKPEIAAAIMDFYTPAFRTQFVSWLNSIAEYPKPFDMSFGRLPELFDVNVDDLFNEGHPKAGCLGQLLKSDDGREYFLQVIFIVRSRVDNLFFLFLNYPINRYHRLINN